MEDGAVPVRDGRLLGTLRLPKKYEKLVKDPMCHASSKKSAIVHTKEEKDDNQMEDMLQAIMWVKQELVSCNFLFRKDIFMNVQVCYGISII